MGEVIAFLSGKGGTGKTAICAAIATALAAGKKKVLCIDCAAGMGSLDIALGISELSALTFPEICRGEYAMDKATVHPKFPTLSYVAAPVSCRERDVDSREFAGILGQARQRFDYVLLDAPAGRDPLAQLAAENADRCVVVTLPDPAAIRCARRTGEALELQGKRDVRLIVNRVNEKMLRAMKLTVDDIVDQTGLQLLGILPVDTDVLEAAAAGISLIHFTNRGAAAAAQRVARRIQGDPVKIPVRNL